MSVQQLDLFAMLEPEPVAEAPPAPVGAWCDRCAEAHPVDAVCPTCQGRAEAAPVVVDKVDKGAAPRASHQWMLGYRPPTVKVQRHERQTMVEGARVDTPERAAWYEQWRRELDPAEAARLDEMFAPILAARAAERAEWG